LITFETPDDRILNFALVLKRDCKLSYLFSFNFTFDKFLFQFKVKNSSVVIVTNDVNLKNKAILANIKSFSFNHLKNHLSDMIDKPQFDILSTSLNFESQNLKLFTETIVTI
jgi:rRNA-processing protein FCF1